MLTATVSGSFHRHMSDIYTAVGELTAAGVKVLSPSDPRIVDYLGEFLFVASDRLRSIRLVQDRHLHCIKASSFLWLVAPDGYVGQSASMEIGFAAAQGKPIYCDAVLSDVTLNQYVTQVSDIRSSVAAVDKTKSLQTTPHLLVDPAGSIELAHKYLDQLSPDFTGYSSNSSERPEILLESTRRFFGKTFGLTTSL